MGVTVIFANVVCRRVSVVGGYAMVSKPVQLSGACTFNSPPVSESDSLYVIVTGMFDISSMLSYDKLRNTGTKALVKNSGFVPGVSDRL